MSSAVTQSPESQNQATSSDVLVVVKRNGKTEAFRPEKIRSAIDRAAKPFRVSDTKIDLVASKVERTVAAISESGSVTVEQIQDCIEIALMGSKLFDVVRSFITYRNKRAELRKDRATPDMRAIRDYVLISKYAAYIPELKRRELFHETVQRRMEMDIRKYPALEKEIRAAFKHVFNFELFPSMRSMQFGGKAIEKQNARIFNCSFTHINRPEVFAGIFHLLLCGCGVGYSVQWQHIESLPELAFVSENGSIIHFDIEDSIEGWADAVDVLVSSYMRPDSKYFGSYIEFNYSKIRKKGTLLKTSGGKAPGHIPLKLALERVRRILNTASGRRLRPIEAHDLICFLADAVLSGGIRRSALICLFSMDDGEMMQAKTGDWWKTNPQRARANNSVIMLRDKVSKDQYDRIFKSTKAFGEPGVYFVDNLDYGCNPCITGDAIIDTTDGPKPVRELVDTPFSVQFGEEVFQCRKGFIQTGIQQTIRITLHDGRSICLTPGHLIRAGTPTDGSTSWTSVADVRLGTFISNSEKYKTTTGLAWSQVVKLEYVEKEAVYDCEIDEIHFFDANGLIAHNCSEILLNPVLTITPAIKKLIQDSNIADRYPGLKLKIGEKYTGFAFCNLCEINVATVTDERDFIERCKAASILGTLQASYTDLPYLGWVSEAIAKREALLGIGLTGIMAKPDIALNPEILQKGAEVVINTNAEFANKIGIRPAARTTTVKPAGTSTLAFGISESGITPAHSKRYFRRIRANELEPVFQYFQSINPHMCERVDGSSTDWFITFPIEVPPGTRLKEDYNGIKLLECVKLVQENWVDPGTYHTEYTKGRHNVSNTITVKPGDWDDVRDYIWQNRHVLNGISMLPDDGDKKYAGAPFEAVVTEADESKWNFLVENYKPVDYSNLVEDTDETAFSVEPACAGGACAI